MNVSKAKKEIVKKGYMKEGETDADFWGVIIMKIPEGTKIFAKSVSPNDRFSIGAQVIFKGDVISVESGQMKMTKIDFINKKLMKSCQNEYKLWDCLVEHIGITNETNQDFYQYMGKIMNMSDAKMQSNEWLSDNYDCKQPCYQLQYQSENLFTGDLENFSKQELLMEKLAEKNLSLNETGVLMLQHVKTPSIIELQEIYSYNGLSFIGDLGGTIGVFLGFSFWSVYLDFLEPAAYKILAYLKN